jgi:hypothetical protein
LHSQEEGDIIVLTVRLFSREGLVSFLLPNFQLINLCGLKDGKNEVRGALSPHTLETLSSLLLMGEEKGVGVGAPLVLTNFLKVIKY